MKVRVLAILAAVLCLGIRAPAQDEPVRQGLQKSDFEPVSDLGAAFQRTRRICRDIEKIRGLPFANEVKVAVQSVEDLRVYVDKEVKRQYGESNVTDFVAALVKLGALEKSIDLSQTFTALLESQAAAHYVPESKTYFLLMTNMPVFMLDVISAHELCHALQDQTFDLERYMMGDLKFVRENSDAAMARQSVVEGEATLVMTAWMLMRQMGFEDPTLVNAAVSMALGCQAAMDMDAIVAVSSSQFEAMGLDTGPMGQAVKDIKKLPRFLVESMFAVYTYGGAMVDAVKSRDGWAGVSQLYVKPPTSMEQVLHPEKLSGAKRDDPVDVRMPELEGRLPPGWILGEEDVLGELGLRIFFRVWRDPADEPLAPNAAAAGWGGDRYYYFRPARGPGDLLVWRTDWDTDADATEFAMAYRLSLARRFPSLKRISRGEGKSGFLLQVWEVTPGRFLKLAMKDRVVGVIDTTDRKLLDVAWE